MRYLVFLVILLSLHPKTFAQKITPMQDSTEVYKKIENYSEKSKFTKTLHRWFFRPTAKKRTKQDDNTPKRDYQEFEGKIIRNIIIETHDPFGFSFTDSTDYAKSWLEKTGNQVHIKSKNLAIRNFLLQKENQALDPLKIMESARLLRSQNYIREVDILVEEIGSTDSVDVSIISLDSWSLIPKATLSATKTKVNLRDRNIIGLGHHVNLGVSKQINTGNTGVHTEYAVPNFLNTFISATGRYRRDFNGYYDKTISVDRDFYSPFTRWAGGVFLQERYLGREMPNDSLTEKGFKFLTQDYWAGHSFRIFQGKSERERTTNLIISLRSLLTNYRESPGIEYDPIDFFSDEKFFLGSIGVTSRQFLQARYIFRDGQIEDIPVGVLYSLTGGYQRKNQQDRMYLGGKVTYGNYFDWGFLSTNVEAGSIFRGSSAEQMAFSFQANYFTNLLSIGGKWKMRQFIKPQFVIGVNRLDSYADRLSLNGSPEFNGPDGNLSNHRYTGGIRGFDSHIVGTQKYVLGLQTQFYSPWQFWGFRLNPYLNITAAKLAKENTIYGSEKLYSSIGIGFIIRNDYLVFSSFQFSFTYYPQIPGEGHSLFQTNVFDSDDFGFQDFQIGKPRTIKYE